MNTSITVKPLVWTTAEQLSTPWGWREHIATHDGHIMFHITITASGAAILQSDPRDERVRFANLAAAQKVAQEQWDQFVRAAIEEKVESSIKDVPRLGPHLHMGA